MRCAICGSTRVVTELKKEGYNKTKGIIGTALFGFIGSIAGTSGNEVIYYHCGDCGQVLNKCMSEYESMELSFALQTQDKSSFLDRTHKMMKKYPNAEWNNEKILKAESNQLSIKSHDNEIKIDGIESTNQNRTTQEEIIDLQKKILEIASKYEDKFTVDEICNNKQLSEYTKIKIFASLTQLVNISCLERMEDDKTYYRFITKEYIEKEKERNAEDKISNIEKEILRSAFKYGDKFTASELKDFDISLSEYATIKISAVLISLAKKAYLTKTENNYKTYYMFNENIYTEILNVLTYKPKNIKEIQNENNTLKDLPVAVISIYCQKLVEIKKAEQVVLERLRYFKKI